MKRKSSYWVLGLLAIAFLAVHSDVVLAASSESLVSQGTGIGGTFDKDFETIAKAFVGRRRRQEDHVELDLGSWPGCQHRQLPAQCLHHAGCLQLWHSRHTVRAGSQEFQ